MISDDSQVVMPEYISNILVAASSFMRMLPKPDMRSSIADVRYMINGKFVIFIEGVRGVFPSPKKTEMKVATFLHKYDIAVEKQYWTVILMKNEYEQLKT